MSELWVFSYRKSVSETQINATCKKNAIEITRCENLLLVSWGFCFLKSLLIPLNDDEGLTDGGGTIIEWGLRVRAPAELDGWVELFWTFWVLMALWVFPDESHSRSKTQ